MKLRDRTVHSSLKPIESHSTDYDNFSNSNPCAGVLVRTGFHSGTNRQMADISYETPVISSICQGEIVELSEIDPYIRAKLLDLSQVCQAIADDMSRHAKRLELLAMSDDSITDELPNIDDPDRDGTKRHHTTPAIENTTMMSGMLGKNPPRVEPTPGFEQFVRPKRGRQAVDWASIIENDEDEVEEGEDESAID